MIYSCVKKKRKRKQKEKKHKVGKKLSNSKQKLVFFVVDLFVIPPQSSSYMFSTLISGSHSVSSPCRIHLSCTDLNKKSTIYA